MSANKLLDRLSDNTLRLCDCRFSLVNEHAGRESYQASHIPGATYVDLGRDLAGPITTTSGRHPLPAAAHWLQTLGQLGITRYSQVVAYDEGSGAMAARLWWMLKWSGVASVALLDGGMAEWQRRALPTERGSNRYPAANFVGKVRSGMQAQAKVILESIDRQQLCDPVAHGSSSEQQTAFVRPNHLVREKSAGALRLKVWPVDDGPNQCGFVESTNRSVAGTEIDIVGIDPLEYFVVHGNNA